jgi:hypothetical protein
MEGTIWKTAINSGIILKWCINKWVKCVKYHLLLCYFLITRLMFYNSLFMFIFVFFIYILCMLCFCIALCIVSPFVLPLSYFIRVYRPLPLGGNPIAVNKYNNVMKRRSRIGVFAAATRLRLAYLTNLSAILDRGEKFFSLPKCSGRL